MRQKYPPLEPFRTGFLEVGDGHSLYFEESGNPSGRPALFLHGGPGSGTEGGHRSFFDPTRYRIILFDQRGAGKSQPHGSLKANTTWDLVADIEKLRVHLKIGTWLVFGGSWGSTLALAYAETHPTYVSALILRGIFLGRTKDISWFYQAGAHHIFADQWDAYLTFIPPEERDDMLGAYYKRLTSTDPDLRKQAAFHWNGWESANLKLRFDPALFKDRTASEALARIECHYFQNRCFFQTENWLIEHIYAIRHIPAVIIHGRYDLVCPFVGAWELHKAWPEAKFEIIADAGHAASEIGITDALIRATDQMDLKKSSGG